MMSSTGQTKKSSIPGLILLAVYVVGALLGFYLSWSCNSNWQRGTISKVFLALMCSLQSWSYVMIYVMYKRGLCNPSSFHPAVH